MTFPKQLAIIALVSVPLLCGCQNNEETGGLLGGVGGAALGAGLGSAIGGNATGALVGAAAGGFAGYLVGSEIGRQLDQRDREMAASATQRALEQPVSNPSTVAAAPPPPAKWQSDHSGASGSAQVIAVQPQSSGGQCKTVHQIAYIQGNEVQQNTRYCQSPNGSWTQA
ncbi:MAG TPA: glycine zipper domain-containing protein [Acetobacteraceae bacterium]|jgi:surface antigen|nr:glycine zipper domain-containing protein [Acetobacteraceae bacterium]